MPPDLADSLDELLEADSIPTLRAVVARHPELLEEQAILILAQATESIDPRVRPRMESLLEAVMEWRSLGLEADVDELAPLQGAHDLSDDLAEMICVQDTAALKAVVLERPALLGDEAERRILEMEADSSAYTADRLSALLTFLRASRSGDIDAAGAAYDHDLAEVEAAGSLAAEYLLMADDVAQAAFLREHPVVLGRQAERAIAGACETLERDPEAAAALGARAKLETVRRLREEARGER